MSQIVLAFVVLSAAVWVAQLIFSLRVPGRRIWPVAAPGEPFPALRSGLSRSTGWMFGISAAALIVLAAGDFGSLGLSDPLSIGLGFLLFASGGAFALGGFRSLGAEISTGTPGELEAAGLYRYSRNPQYVGTIGVLIGFAMLSNSVQVLIGAGAWSVWYLVAPFPEEVWLRQLLGEPYTAYLRKTRRYL